MVVPTHGFSDYCNTGQYLSIAFRDQIVARRRGAVVTEALVRTTLVVARRVPDRGSGQVDSTRKHIHIRLCTNPAKGSIVGSAYPHSERPEVEFASDVATLAASSSTTMKKDKLRARWVTLPHPHSLGARPGDHKWLRDYEPDLVRRNPNGIDKAPVLPAEVRDIVGELSQVWSLDSVGWHVGQGLRTGANRFFYGDLVDERPDEILVQVDPEINPKPVPVPLDATRTVVRKQSDLVKGKRPEESLGRLLLLNCYALPEDLDTHTQLFGPSIYCTIPNACEHVRRACF